MSLQVQKRSRVDGRVPHSALHAPRSTLHAPRSTRAFTLIEVMIALGIFFMAVFSILALVSGILRNARGLQRPQVDAGLAAAIYINTNRFSVGSVSGDFGDLEALRDFSYEVITEEFATNGLLQAGIILNKRGGHTPPDTISILVFDPNFQSTPFSGRPR
jgi:hypothetical protein